MPRPLLAPLLFWMTAVLLCAVLPSSAELPLPGAGGPASPACSWTNPPSAVTFTVGAGCSPSGASIQRTTSPLL